VKFKGNLRTRNAWFLGMPALVDLLFLILIFIIFGNMVVNQPGIAVDFPETPGDPLTAADKLIIILTKERQIYFNDQAVPDWEALEDKLAEVTYRKTGQRMSKPVILLNADRTVANNDVVRILSIARRYASRVALVTTPEKP